MAKKTDNSASRRSQRERAGAKNRLRIIPLGGLGEIGKNMTAFEYGDDIIVVDVGSIFPREDMPGVDLVIPDISYLTMNRGRVRGYLITHGHEDHIGAAPYVLREVPAPVYATRLTAALIESKLKEHKLLGSVEMNVIAPHDTVTLGVFRVEFLKVSHSIAGACALAIHTPVGVVVHTGDFKVDFTPIDGQLMDLGRFAALGNEGVLALMADSTNVERPGYTMSERKVGETFNNLFDHARGRIIIAMFASNVHRIQMVADAAYRRGRRLCLVGRSMVNVARISMQLGELRVPDGWLVGADDLDRYSDEQLVVLTTGSQGEPMSGLSRMAFSEHKKLEIRPTDMVIISATPIPGNEKSVSRVINQLVRTGADVIYEESARFCDVVSVNIYNRRPVKDLPATALDKPLINGEFHFGALDRGLFHTGLVGTRDQAERAQCYRDFLNACLDHPRFVGTHWFQWQDQALTGRSDGENYQIGFVTVTDTPYPELVEAARDIGATMYARRWGAEGANAK